MIRTRTLPALAATLLAAAPAAGQAVRGTVVDENDAPVPAATVLLVEAAGTVRNSARWR